jgi:hypothetical protein
LIEFGARSALYSTLQKRFLQLAEETLASSSWDCPATLVPVKKDRLLGRV